MRVFLLVGVWLWSLALAFPRIGVHEGFTRLVFDLPSKEVQHTLSQENGLLVLILKGVKAAPMDQVVNSSEVASVQTLPEGGQVRVVVRLKGAVEATVRRYSDPERLVVDLSLKKEASTPAKALPDPPRSRPPKPPKPVVLLDPGHGGMDPGMVGYVVEKEVVLDVALRLERLLEREGIEVRLTRDRDMHLSPDKREDLSRRAALADSSQVNLFISLHVNATPTRTAQGVEVFYFGRAQDARVLTQVIRENGGGELGKRLTQEARTVAERILFDIVAQANQRYSQRLAETLGRKLSQTTGSPFRGTFPGDFFVLRYAKVPAVLVEMGFGDHPAEGRRLADPTYREKVAQGLLSGILTFLANGAYAR
ncbi:N-acetylmuramoyl-L-alanine amidase [Thermus scotoductus]|uniref:N-acetylmuramoyl-L-alanine amidase n=1 Tax=Thermus scotoductus TaxID=37636 RepID=A0A430RYF7_THESC|nr:N-acetylmuramoyl-L-alanine amidase [Thermus scotoductus]RTG93809.1 N-acetylmuramoyl-L-alanine amidase [Thermus scotoductus]RTG96034.1 N-acetylmuramoyl-L-alanine amidase [Thermus scotoductus]RTH00589.1 N-acetylmuramoyl-L-alanine amidase [Thermus scotoductus]RTH07157.1 N-acetylmuramoyl-L-alanine amidase [Thermus scotoductus]RTH10112.1 N-acetylmuramoyl-L-alanine amidase [Thermus scotoductus]